MEVWKPPCVDWPYAASVVADDVKLIPELVELLQAVGYENTIALHPIRGRQKLSKTKGRASHIHSW